MVKIQLTNELRFIENNDIDLTSKIEKHSVKQLRKCHFHLKIMSPLMLGKTQLLGLGRKISGE